jgi:hypothetical protein
MDPVVVASATQVVLQRLVAELEQATKHSESDGSHLDTRQQLEAATRHARIAWFAVRGLYSEEMRSPVAPGVVSLERRRIQVNVVDLANAIWTALCEGRAALERWHQGR